MSKRDKYNEYKIDSLMRIARSEHIEKHVSARYPRNISHQLMTEDPYSHGSSSDSDMENFRKEERYIAKWR